MTALLSFFTALPARGSSLDEAAKSVYLLPLVGLLTGLSGAAALFLGYAIPPGVAATLGLGAALLAAGLHHTDGVLDAGDALMVRGDPGRRRAALRDTRVGVGGITALFLVYAPAVAALAAVAEGSPAVAALTLLAGEVCARCAMLFMLAFGEPADRGSSSVPFVHALQGPRRTAGLVLALVAPLPFLLFLGGIAPLALLVAPLLAALALRASRSAFGGIGGDTVGATGEAARTVLLVIVSSNA